LVPNLEDPFFLIKAEEKYKIPPPAAVFKACVLRESKSPTMCTCKNWDLDIVDLKNLYSRYGEVKALRGILVIGRKLLSPDKRGNEDAQSFAIMK
jgi:hypothetical protein